MIERFKQHRKYSKQVNVTEDTIATPGAAVPQDP
jgi:hypothetical protein